jgi:hypothetical protein
MLFPASGSTAPKRQRILVMPAMALAAYCGNESTR